MFTLKNSKTKDMVNCNSYILSGIPIDCGSDAFNRGGIIDQIYLVPFSDVVSTAVGSPNGGIATITLTSGVVLKAYEFIDETSSWTEEFNLAQRSWTQTVTLVLKKRDKSKADEIQLLATVGQLAIFVKDSNGKYWMVGQEFGAKMATAAYASGTAFTDQNQWTITFTTLEPEVAPLVLGSAIEAVI